MVELGELEVISVVEEPETPENPMVFDPMRLTDGIEPSDDPILAARPEGLRGLDRAADRQHLAAAQVVVEAEHEGRVVRQDPLDLLVGRIRVDPEEALHLPGPLVHVEPHQRELLGVRDLGGVEVANLAPAAQLALAGRAQVAHPLGVAARRQQVGAPSISKGLTGLVRISPLLRPRNASVCEPWTLIPSRWRPLTSGFTTWVVNQSGFL